ETPQLRMGMPHCAPVLGGLSAEAAPRADILIRSAAHGWLGQWGAINNNSLPSSATLLSTCWRSGIGGKAYRRRFGHWWPSTSMPSGGSSAPSEHQRGQQVFCLLANRSTCRRPETVHASPLADRSPPSGGGVCGYHYAARH